MFDRVLNTPFDFFCNRGLKFKNIFNYETFYADHGTCKINIFLYRHSLYGLRKITVIKDFAIHGKRQVVLTTFSGKFTKGRGLHHTCFLWNVVKSFRTTILENKLNKNYFSNCTNTLLLLKKTKHK